MRAALVFCSLLLASPTLSIPFFLHRPPPTVFTPGLSRRPFSPSSVILPPPMPLQTMHELKEPAPTTHEPALRRLISRLLDLESLGKVMWVEAAEAGSAGGVAEGVRSAMSKWDAWVDIRAPLLHWTAFHLTQQLCQDVEGWYPYGGLALPRLIPAHFSAEPPPKLLAAITPLLPSLRAALIRSPALLARLAVRALAWWALVSCRMLGGFIPVERRAYLRELVLDDVALALERHHAESLPEHRAMLAPPPRRPAAGRFAMPRPFWAKRISAVTPTRG